MEYSFLDKIRGYRILSPDEVIETTDFYKREALDNLNSCRNYDQQRVGDMKKVGSGKYIDLTYYRPIKKSRIG